jgi:uncharacterized protein (DUF58 family)
VTSTFRPTRGAYVLLAAAPFVYTMGRVLGDAWMLFAACTLGALPVVAAVLTPRLTHVHVDWSGPMRTVAGAELPLRVALRVPGRRTPDLRVLVTHPAMEARDVFMPMASATDGVAAHLTTVAPFRGRWPDGAALLVRTSSLWGLWQSVAHVELPPRPLIVRPAPAPPVDVPTGGRGTSDLTSGRAGNGLEIFGVREWQSSDGASGVHWRTSARRGRLTVLEREQHLARALVVIVTATPDPARTEHLVAQAHATAVRHAQGGATVRLLGSGVQPLDRGDVVAVGDWFAAVQPQGEPPVALLRLFVREAAAVLWTGTPPSDVARSAMRGVPLVVLDAAPS